jgi:hypothetical protein
VRLAKAARDETLPEPAATVLELANALARFLGQAEPQRPRQPGPVPRAASPAAAPLPPTEEDLEEERLFLAAATAHPEDLAHLG